MKFKNTNYMRRFIPIIVAIMLGVVTVSAQKLPGKCSVWYPATLAKKAVIEESDLKEFAKGSKYGQGSESTNRHWVVYSDRDNNTTYTTPGGAPTNTPLAFNEQVRIAQIQGDYALVYYEPLPGIEYPKISSGAESKGWIPMKNLLLWHSCPADKHGIYQKALICANLDAAGGESHGNLYLNPGRMSDVRPLSADMKFYFIMKKEGSLALLADVHSMDGTSNEVLYGWVHSKDYVPWNQRSCLEPTWDPEAVKFFASRDKDADFYEDPAGKQYVAGDEFKVLPEPARYDPHLYRMNPKRLRYPLLDGSTQTMFNVSTFTTLGGGSVASVVDEQAEVMAKVEKISKEMANINIGIVIDGTSSMEKYYETVANALKESVTAFGENRNVKIGALIYRDYTDGAYAAEVISPMTEHNNPRLYEALIKGGQYGIKSSEKDTDYAEALYNGIDVALDKLGFKKGQSNILLVVGDCGNHRNDSNISREKIIDKLVSKEVQIMSFQVRRTTHESFTDYSAQMGYITKSALNKMYAKLPGVNGEIVSMVKSPDGYTMNNTENSILYIGSHSFPQRGATELSLDKIKNLIIYSMAEYSRSVDKQINAMRNPGGFARSSSSDGSSENEMKINEAFVRSRLGNDAEFEMLKQQNVLITFKGYTHKEFEARQIFKPVIFISSDELTTLIAQLEPVNSAAAISDHNNRAPYVNAMIGLLKAQAGSSIDVERASLADIQRNIYGLNAASDVLASHTLEEIASPDAVNKSEYVSLIEDFKRKYKKLIGIKERYKYVIPMNGIIYYWIPVEDLP